jgi:tRNA (cmo5U34)-methyltransferase
LHHHHSPNFDKVAPFYDGLSRLVFGSALRRAQVAHVAAIPENACVLLIGGGSGWLLEQLLRQKPKAKVTYLEASPKMVQLARQRLARDPGIAQAAASFCVGTENDLLPGESFDVIITPFLLDLFPDERLQVLLDRLCLALVPGGLWLFSDFWPVEKPRPYWQQLLLKSMYTFFRLVSHVQANQLPDFEQHFNRLPLQEMQTARFYKGMVQAKVYRKEMNR